LEEVENKMSRRNILDILTDADPRWIYLLCLTVLSAPLIFPVGLPLVVGDNARGFYTYIESLPEGSKVAFSWGADSMTWMEQGLGATVILKHLMMNPGIKIVAFSNMAQGPLYWKMTLEKLGTYGKEYGVDYVYLGYLPGKEAMFAAVAADVWGACGGKDAYGKSLEDLPLMSDIHSANDFDLYIHLPNGIDPVMISIRQWQMPYEIPFYCIPLGAVQSSLVSYRKTGQISGWIGSAREAAEYELLMNSPGLALSGMDAQSFGHIFIIVLIIIGNVGYFIKKSRGIEK